MKSECLRITATVFARCTIDCHGDDFIPLRELYEQICRHVEQSQRHIQRQQDIVSELEDKGHDSSEAQNLLELFMRVQELHVAHMRRLQQELERSPTCP
jgi:hypothetical protein